MSTYRVLTRDRDGLRTYVYVIADSLLEALDSVPGSITARRD